MLSRNFLCKKCESKFPSFPHCALLTKVISCENVFDTFSEMLRFHVKIRLEWNDTVFVLNCKIIFYLKKNSKLVERLST